MSTRLLPKEEWIKKHGSGKACHSHLRNARIETLYIEERVGFTWGHAFQRVASSRVMFGPGTHAPELPDWKRNRM